MTFKKLISYCKPIEVSGPEPTEIGVLVQDSRQVSDGDVFIAIQGSQMDGHSFIPQAIQNGAKVIITMQAIPDNEDVCFVRVENTRELLGPLAQAFEGNPARDMTLIGITGTNGKTTVATLTYQILRELDAKPALLGTVEKRIGDEIFESKLTTSDPIELAADMRKMVDAGTSHMIMEVSSHALDQGRVDGLKFQVAAFTNLSHDHLDYHKTVEAYAKSKKQLFDHLDRDSWAIINGDDEQADFMLGDCTAQTVRFSFKESLDVECQILSNTTEGLTVRIGKTMIESPLAGKFNAYNIAEAFLICEALGYPGEKIARILKTATGAAGRLEKVQVSSEGNEPTVMVDYAHTPDALRNVSETLASLKTSNQKLHIVFGCGGNRDKAKRPEMARIAQQYGDVVTVTSDNPRDENPNDIIDEIMAGFEQIDQVNRIPDRRKAITDSILQSDEQTIILIAGKGHETYQEVKGQRHEFDDRQIAREALVNRNKNLTKRGL